MRQRELGGRTIACAATLLAFSCALPQHASARQIATEQDRAATHAYLQARYVYDKAQLASAKESHAAVEAVGSRLAGECPAVLAKAPRPEEAVVARLSGHPLSPHATGVANRQTRQLADLSYELDLTEEQAALGSLRSAAAEFAQTVSGLRWSNRDLTTYEHTRAEEIEWVLDAPPPNVCADMRSWVNSGYLSLPPATRQIASELAPTQERFDLVFFNPNPHISTSAFEGPDDKALTRRAARLEKALALGSEATRMLRARVEGDLGLLNAKQVEEQEGIPKGSVLIAHGKTPPNRSYKVWVEPKRTQSHTGCVRLRVEEAVRAHGGSIDASSEQCLSRAHPQALRTECTPPHEITISAELPDRVRRVVLMLSDGRQMSAEVAHVPARLGGPFGYYYMKLRTRKPIPVSLREIGAGGRSLATRKLHVTGYCHSQPLPSRKHFVPVARELVAGRLPGGPVFALIGERSGRSRRSIEIQLRVPSMASAPVIYPFGQEPDRLTAPRHGNSSKPFTWKLSSGCQPHPYGILFGLLRNPADTVQARTAHGLVTLRHASLPTPLRTAGVLAYVALGEVPGKIVVDSPSGKTLRVESLAGQAREATEVCEGEDEPAA